MKTRELELALAATDPVDRESLEGLDFEGMEADLLADLDGVRSGLSTPAPKHRRTHPRRLALTLTAAALATAIVAVLVLAGGGTDHPSRAYGAELVRFAKSTPLLLLEGPDWRVQNVSQVSGEGTMEFVTGKPIPYESIRISGNKETGVRESGMFPAAVRQRRVELFWRHGRLNDWISMNRGMPHPHGQRWIKLPVLGATADVDTRAEGFVNHGGPGDRQMIAFWAEGGYMLELKAAVPDLAAFEDRLDWLNRVDSQTWLDAMPAKVVKAADHDSAVREMLKGIPVPAGFKIPQVSDPGLTTSRYQVGATVTGTVSCLWFRQWGEARRAGDSKAAAEAEKAMATAKSWPVLHQMAKDGAYPELVWQLAAAMPSGEWPPRGWRLLPHAEGLGCARWGIPVLPWKQQLQLKRRGL